MRKDRARSRDNSYELRYSPDKNSALKELRFTKITDINRQPVIRILTKFITSKFLNFLNYGKIIGLDSVSLQKIFFQRHRRFSLSPRFLGMKPNSPAKSRELVKDFKQIRRSNLSDPRLRKLPLIVYKE